MPSEREGVEHTARARCRACVQSPPDSANNSRAIKGHPRCWPFRLGRHHPPGIKAPRARGGPAQTQASAAASRGITLNWPITPRATGRGRRSTRRNRPAAAFQGPMPSMITPRASNDERALAAGEAARGTAAASTKPPAGIKAGTSSVKSLAKHWTNLLEVDGNLPKSSQPLGAQRSNICQEAPLRFFEGLLAGAHKMLVILHALPVPSCKEAAV